MRNSGKPNVVGVNKSPSTNPSPGADIRRYIDEHGLSRKYPTEQKLGH
jgi:hypothetical protein